LNGTRAKLDKIGGSTGFLQEAATVFGDPLAVTFPDPDHSASEQRFITVGMSSAGRILIVAHMDRDEDIRIISARKTTQRERKHYEEKN
jgi:uncharacterized DUF497 family protein